jgi:hypothetical protein
MCLLICVVHSLVMNTGLSSNACSICNETRVHHERIYTIQGQRVIMRFAACLHDADEQTKGGARDDLRTPP